MIVSLTVHEFAHAFVATKLGDTTAKDQGRLTLAPHVHLDPIGSLLIPALGAISGFPFIGWARPVPFNPARFKRNINMWRGSALVAVAGPLSNLVLAVVAALVMRVLQEVSLPENVLGMLARVLPSLLLLNVFLFLFNLLPLPPLDGGYLIPRSYEHVRETLARYSFLIFIGLMVTGLFRRLLVPPMQLIAGGLVWSTGLSPVWFSGL
ncbi:MAG: site-2 protease family protein [Deltaproteobacteria bacterium]|nr:site-2 protease family protein [Deltaproteobacteria bacterium]